MDIKTRALIKLVKYDLEVAQSNSCSIEQKIYRLTNALGTLLNLFEQPTTAPVTPNVPTPEDPSVVESYKESGLDVTIPTTQPSSQSDQADTQSGPAEHDSECAHHWATFFEEFGKAHYRVITSGSLHHYSTLWCQKCGALRLSGAILVPAAGRTSSTSVKQPLKESVENSQEESVKSQSNKSIRHHPGCESWIRDIPRKCTCEAISKKAPSLAPDIKY